MGDHPDTLNPAVLGDGERSEIRGADDFKASWANDILSAMDMAAPDNLDAFLAIATYFSLTSPSPDLSAFTEDFAHAYKNIGIHARRAGSATIPLDPPDGALRVATLSTQPFGGARAGQLGPCRETHPVRF